MVTSTVTLVLLGTLATDAVNWPTVMFSEASPTSPSTMASLTVNCLGAAGGGSGEGLGGGGDGGGGEGDGGGGEGDGGGGKGGEGGGGGGRGAGETQPEP